MLSRLRGNRQDAKAVGVNGSVEAAKRGDNGDVDPLAGLGGVESSPSVTETLTIDVKAALLTDSLVEITTGITMPFSRQELARIKRRFASMLLPDSLTSAPMAVCITMPELAASPFAALVMKTVANSALPPPQVAQTARKSPRKRNPAREVVSFDQFLTTLSILSVKQSIQVKRQVLFKVYDADRDGFVSVDDFVVTLSAITSSLSRSELRAAVLSQYPSWATDSSTTLNDNSFQQFFSDADVHAALTIAF